MSVTIDARNRAENLRLLFEPKGVAVIGASSKNEKIGYEILRNIVDGQYAGQIYPVNPHDENILGLKVYRSITDVPDVVHTCIITVPPESVPQVLLECGRKNVKGAIVITAGFSEVGNIELEEQVLKSALKWGVRVVGPNCAGIINTEKKLYATIESRIAPGSIAFITQSGALGGAVLASAREQRIGLSKFVSYGNRSDVDEAELLEYLSADNQTKVIAAYIEGLREGRRFIQTARRVSEVKPVLAIKGGSSAEGSRATLSHTGALAGSDQIYDGAFRQAGIIRAQDLDDLLDMAKALSYQPIPKGERIGITTNSGGPGVMMTDALANLSLKVPEPSSDTMGKLAFLPAICSRKNPIDLTAGTNPESYERTLRVLAESDDFDALVAIFIPPAFQKSEMITEAVLHVTRTISKPVVACFMAGDLVREAVEALEKGGVPNFPTVRRTAKAVWALVQRGRFLNTVAHQSECKVH
jgi:acetyl coenzyme A synthetase (ADP forming)-like protein